MVQNSRTRNKADNMINEKKMTTCPRCTYKFEITKKSRAYQIKREYAPFWFFDAINQFEHFREVRCPSCGHIFEAKEARLLFFFRSPYTVVLLCVLLAIFSIILVFKLR